MLTVKKPIEFVQIYFKILIKNIIITAPVPISLLFSVVIVQIFPSGSGATSLKIPDDGGGGGGGDSLLATLPSSGSAASSSGSGAGFWRRKQLFLSLRGLKTGARPLWCEAMWTLRLVRWAKPVSQ